MAAAQIPVALLPALNRPIIGNPVVLEDVTNAIRFVAFASFSSTYIFSANFQLQLSFGCA